MPILKMCKKCGKTKIEVNANPKEKCKDCGGDMEIRAEVKNKPVGWGRAVK